MGEQRTRKPKVNLPTVRVALAELRALRSEAPTEGVIRGSKQASALERVIGELRIAALEDYSGFKVETTGYGFGPGVDALEYRSTLGALIARVEAKFGLAAPAAVSSGPHQSWTVNMKQEQDVTQAVEQQVEVAIHNQLVALVAEREPNYTPDSKEGQFLGKLKSSLAFAKDGAGLITAVAGAAHAARLSPQDILRVLGLH